MRDNTIWVEITDKRGFIFFGDLSRYQKKEGINVSNSEVDIICENCPHKLRFSKKEVETKDGKSKVWDWWKWRVFLRGNQISKSDLGGYYGKLSINFYCTHCQDDLPSRS